MGRGGGRENEFEKRDLDMDGVELLEYTQFKYNLSCTAYWKCNFPMTPSVGRLVGQSVFHNFPKGQEVHFQRILSEHLFCCCSIKSSL